ncbi:MAG: hypothetical protein R3F56_19625 [Planctomycetota bacterium]
MSRKPGKNDVRELDELPLFREPTAATSAPAASEPEEEMEFAELDDALDSLEDLPEEAIRPTARVRPDQAVGRQPAAVHGAWIGLGITIFLLGILMAVATASRPPALAQLLDAVTRMGLTPTLLLGFGIATWGVGIVLGRQQRNGDMLFEIATSLHEVLAVADQVDATTQALHEADATRAATAMSGDEIGQVLFALQRHEEKLNNLTKATKTFGKPLVEMTSQLADVAAQVANSQTNVQAVRVATEGGMNRIEEILRKQSESGSSAGDGLQRALADAMTEVQSKLDAALGHGGPDALQKHLTAFAHDVDKKLAASNQKVCADLGKELAGRIAELGKGGRAASVDLSPIQDALAALRREITSLGGSTPSGRDKSGESTPPPPAKTGGTAGDEPPASGLAQSIAGERSAKGTNVLGAIAKLKKMRS